MLTKTKRLAAAAAIAGGLIAVGPVSGAQAWPEQCVKGQDGALNNAAWARCTAGTGEYRVVVQLPDGQHYGPWMPAGGPGHSSVNIAPTDNGNIGWELRG